MKPKPLQPRPANVRPPAPEPVRVRFEFTDPKALSVSVAGSFNDWHPTTRSMFSTGNGHWLKEAELPPGVYEYCLIVDGKWMPDPLAQESVANPFGGRNSVLKLACSPAATHLAAAETQPFLGNQTN